MRPVPNFALTYDVWMADIERRISEIDSQAATPKWCSFLGWQSLLLLHMPCSRNPNPSEDSVLKYFDAAVRITNSYWDLVQLDQVDNPWHATHHCYEAGNLILYSLWYFPTSIRREYTIRQVFDAVHQVSSFFVSESI